MPSAVSLLALDADGFVTTANPAACRHLGAPVQELVGRPMRDALLTRDASGALRPFVGSPVLRAVQTQAELEGEDAWLERPDGSVFPISYTVAPIRTRDAVEGAVLCFRDRTARRELEEERERWMRLMEAFYRAHDRLGIGLVIIGGDVVTYSNEAFRALVRRELTEAASLLDLVRRDHREQVLSHFRAVLSGAAAESALDFDLVGEGHEHVPVRAFVAPAEEPGAPHRRLVCIIQPR